MHRLTTIVFFGIAFILMPFIGNAGFLDTPLHFDVSPLHPERGEAYTVTLPLYSSDFNQSRVRWFINGREAIEYEDERTINLSPLESDTKITARLTSPQGQMREVRRTISAVRVDLLFNAHTLVPAFYKGSTLPSSGSTLTATALVFKNDTRLVNGLSYLWRVNGKLHNSSSKANTISITPSFEQEMVVSVEIQDANNQTLANETMLVPVVKPEIQFYEMNPLSGLSFRRLETPFNFIGDEMTIRAEGYFIAQELLGMNVLRKWEIAGEEFMHVQNPQEITLQKLSSGDATTVSFEMRNLQQLLQGARGSLTIRY